MKEVDELFEEYNIKYNPFPETGLNFPIIDRTGVMDKLKTRLDSAIVVKSPQMYVLLGDYGIGKSFALKNLEMRINSGDFFSLPRKVIIAKMTMSGPKPPSNYLLYFYRQIMNSIKGKFYGLFEEIKNKNNPKLLNDIDDDFRLAFSLLDSDYEKIALSFLIADEELSLKEIKEAGLKSKIDDDEKALKMLLEFLKIIKKLEYESLFVLIDEFEYIFTATGTQRTTQIIITFRFIFDKINDEIDTNNNLTKTIFIFTSTPHAWQQLSERVEFGGGTPFVQRVADKIILPPFGEEDTERLLKSRLKPVRINAHDKEKIGLYPFKKDFILYIISISDNGLPRMILKNCSLILDVARQKGHKEIGQKEAQTIMEEWQKI